MISQSLVSSFADKRSLNLVIHEILNVKHSFKEHAQCGYFSSKCMVTINKKIHGP